MSYTSYHWKGRPHCRGELKVPFTPLAYMAFNAIIPATPAKKSSYKFVNEHALLDDFIRDVNLILEGKL